MVILEIFFSNNNNFTYYQDSTDEYLGFKNY